MENKRQNLKYTFHFLTESQSLKAKIFLNEILALDVNKPEISNDGFFWNIDVICEKDIDKNVLFEFLSHYNVIKEDIVDFWDTLSVVQKSKIQIPIFKTIFDILFNISLNTFKGIETIGAFGQIFSDLTNYLNRIPDIKEFKNILHELNILSFDDHNIQPLQLINIEKIIFSDTGKLVYYINDFEKIMKNLHIEELEINANFIQLYEHLVVLHENKTLKEVLEDIGKL